LIPAKSLIPTHLIVPIGKNAEKAALQETKILPYPINSVLFIKNQGEILVVIRWQHVF